MQVLVDSSVWSYALRSKNQQFTAYIEVLKALISQQRVLIIGAIRQELLSGYSDLKKFELLKQKLNSFPNTLTVDEDYIQAAKFSNTCRAKGIQGSHTDFLICAVANRLEIEVLTTDKDFNLYMQHIPIKLYPVYHT
jgi:predicted nucleic acid-binding protein